MHSANQKKNNKILTKVRMQHFKGTVWEVLACLPNKINEIVSFQ